MEFKKSPVVVSWLVGLVPPKPSASLVSSPGIIVESSLVTIDVGADEFVDVFLATPGAVTFDAKFGKTQYLK